VCQRDRHSKDLRLSIFMIVSTRWSLGQLRFYSADTAPSGTVMAVGCEPGKKKENHDRKEIAASIFSSFQKSVLTSAFVLKEVSISSSPY
jgi:hypothetical protein